MAPESRPGLATHCARGLTLAQAWWGSVNRRGCGTKVEAPGGGFGGHGIAL